MKRFSRYAGYWRVAACGLAGLAGSLAEAKVLEFKVTETISPIFDGQSFGTVGQYERLKGTITGAVDPKSPLNTGIVDLGLAAVNADGLVEYSANFMIFRPLDASKGNRKVIYDLNNRGNVLGFGLFNDAAANSNDPKSAADAGNGFLMRNGYTIVLSGWDLISPKVPGGGPLSPHRTDREECRWVADCGACDGRVYHRRQQDREGPIDLSGSRTCHEQGLTARAHFWSTTTPRLSPPTNGSSMKAGRRLAFYRQERSLRPESSIILSIKQEIQKSPALHTRPFVTVAEYLRNGPSSPVPQLTKIYATCEILNRVA